MTDFWVWKVRSADGDELEVLLRKGGMVDLLKILQSVRRGGDVTVRSIGICEVGPSMGKPSENQLALEVD